MACMNTTAINSCMLLLDLQRYVMLLADLAYNRLCTYNTCTVYVLVHENDA